MQLNRQSVKFDISLKAGLGMAVLLLVMMAIIAGWFWSSGIQSAERNGLLTVERIAGQLDARNQRAMTLAQTLGDMQTTGGFGNRQTSMDFMKRVVEQNPEIIGSYFNYEPGADGQDAAWNGRKGMDRGRFVPYWNRFTGSLTLDATVDLDSLEVYVTPKKSLKPIISEPYLYEGVLLASYGVPLVIGDRFRGISGVDVDLNDINRELQALKPFKSAKFAVLTSQGKFIAAPDDTLLAKQIKDDAKLQQAFGEAIASGKTGTQTLASPFGGHKAWMFHAPVQNGKWTVALLVEESEIVGPIVQRLLLLVGVGVVGIVVIVLFLSWLVGKATQLLDPLVLACEAIAHGELSRVQELVPLEAARTAGSEFKRMIQAFRQATDYLSGMAEAVSLIAKGDLTREITPQSERDQLGNAIFSMQDSLRGIVQKVRGSAETVSAASTQTSQAVEETSSSMEEMAASIRQVADNAQELAASVEETSSSISEMAASIQQVAGNTDTLASAVNETSASIEEMAASIQQVAENVQQANGMTESSAEAARRGKQAVTESVEGMAQIQEAMGKVVSTIESLDRNSTEIGQIIAVIDDIADQTNLLALNAAIEAARAGEAGRGFAVVADEVRKLAERSASATREIGDLIKGIQRETREAVQSTQQSESAIREGTELTRTAGESLDAIVHSVDQVRALMSEITQAASEQSRAARQITEAVGSMSALTHQVSIASTEQARGSEQINQAIHAMSSLTQQVSAATSEQRTGADQVVRAVEDVRMVSGSLQRESRSLLDEIAFFKEAELTLAIPPAPETQLKR
ncbi:Methyl-accepting chemotaxis protein PctC [compost metagenome]